MKEIVNNPTLWKKEINFPNKESNKYSCGYVVVIGGDSFFAGAAKLAAYAALRTGCGIASIAIEKAHVNAYSPNLMSIMTKIYSSKLIHDDNITAFSVGSGCGLTKATKTKTLQILSTKKPVVIDADSISIFQDNPKELFSALHSNCVLTPHKKEFSRIFDLDGSNVQQAKKAAQIAGCVMMLKGNDTVIASHDGKVILNRNAPTWLATAGSGDVLSGIIASLLARKMNSFNAAAAGVWIHSQAARRFSYGMISEDLPQAIPSVLKLLGTNSK